MLCAVRVWATSFIWLVEMGARQEWMPASVTPESVGRRGYWWEEEGISDAARSASVRRARPLSFTCAVMLCVGEGGSLRLP